MCEERDREEDAEGEKEKTKLFFVSNDFENEFGRLTRKDLRHTHTFA